jgi:ribosomal 30S subunit maturation factor RimM
LKAFEVEKGYLGDIVDVWSGGASDILVIRSGEKEVLIPAISEFIKAVELEKGRITVRMWEEM